MVGGAFINLCKKLTDEYEINKINELINKGNLTKINLNIQDVTTKEIKTLPKDTTAVNFGKLYKTSQKQDIIIGLLNMIVETIGMMAAFAVKEQDCKEVILTGNFMKFTKAYDFFKRIETIQDVKFIMPIYPEFATILGAIKKSN